MTAFNWDDDVELIRYVAAKMDPNYVALGTRLLAIAAKLADPGETVDRVAEVWPPADASCASCRFGWPSDHMVECHRHAPSLVGDDVGIFPMTFPDTVCGDYFPASVSPLHN